MHGTKKITDGHIRLDMPGGFPGDDHSEFTPEGRTPLQREAWDFISSVLQWRRSPEVNEVIARGSLKHFMPQNGLYIYEPREVTMERTVEILPYGTRMHNMVSGEEVTVAETMTFAPREVLILQNF